MSGLVRALVVAGLLGALTAPAAAMPLLGPLVPPPPEEEHELIPDRQPEVLPGEPAEPAIAWRTSRSLGEPWAGRLELGVQLPAEGPDFFTWDPVLKRSPDREWRRWGTDRLVRTLLAVLRDYRAAFPDAPRVGVGDLSRRHGGDFGKRFGGRGHASHQNGLDVDVYYPRLDRLERRAYLPAQVDQVLAQELVDRFVVAGAEKVYVGPRLDLRGPRRVVSKLIYHDDHLHVRLPPR